MTDDWKRLDPRPRTTTSDVPPSYVRGLLTGSIALTASGALTVAVAAISIGLAITLAGAEVVGQWSVILSIAALLGVLDLGLSATVTRFTADAMSREDRSAVVQVWVTASFAVLGVVTMAGSLVLLLPNVIAGLIHASEPATAFWLPAIVASQMTSGQTRAALIGLGKTMTAGALEMAGSLGSLALTFTLLHRGLGLDALAIGAAARGIVMVVPGLLICASAIGHVSVSMPERSLIGSLLAYSLPMFAAVAAGVAFLNLGRIMLSLVSTIHAVGVYEAANRIALILPAAASPVLTAALPLITARRHQEALVGNVTKMIQSGLGLVTGLLAGGLLCIGLPILESWMGGPIPSLGWTLSLLLIAYLLVAGTGPTNVVLRANGLQWIEALSLASGTIVLVGSVYLLAPRFGALGAAAAIALGATVNVGLLKTMVARTRLKDANLRLRTLAASCFLMLIAGLLSDALGVGGLLDHHSPWLLVAILLLIVMTAILLAPTIRSLTAGSLALARRDSTDPTTRNPQEWSEDEDH